MRILLLFVLLTMFHVEHFAMSATSEEITRLIHAIHKVETGGRLGSILGDGGKALGPLQIHFSYWKDAVDFDKTIRGTYNNCASLEYSEKIVKSYFKKYGRGLNVEGLAKLHNGGPRGPYNKRTEKYWRLIKEELKNQI